MRKLPVLASLLAVLTLSQTSWAKPVLTDEIGKFELYQDSDPITDEDRSYISTTSDTGYSWLKWMCVGDKLQISLRYTSLLYYKRDGYLVIHRFDKETPIETRNWNSIEQSSSIYLRDSEVRNFTKKSMLSKQIAMRSTDGDSDVATAIFELDGLKESLGKLSCAKTMNFNQ